MNPQRRSFHPSEQANLHQQHIMPSTSFESAIPVPSPSANSSTPPPVPPRSGSPYQSTMPGSMFGYGMNPYGMNNFGYGGIMSGYGNPMMMGSLLPQDSMLHGVEDVGRSAFQTVGSVVQTLGSVSVMLQSTLFAVQNSVQAILSVANQFGHLRTHLIEICISFIRIIKYYYRKLLYLFRFDRRAAVDKIWEEAAHQTTTGAHDHRGMILFFAVVIGTPYLIWSFVKSVVSQSNLVNQWQQGGGEHFVGEATYTYKAVNRDELSVTSGDTIYIAPKHKQPVIKGWILAAKSGKIGLVPANYIKIQGKGNNNIDDVNSKIEELKGDEYEQVIGLETATFPDDQTAHDNVIKKTVPGEKLDQSPT